MKDKSITIVLIISIVYSSFMFIVIIDRSIQIESLRQEFSSISDKTFINKTDVDFYSGIYYLGCYEKDQIVQYPIFNESDGSCMRIDLKKGDMLICNNEVVYDGGSTDYYTYQHCGRRNCIAYITEEVCEWRNK